METKRQLSLGTLYEANKRLMSNKEIFKPMNVLEIGGAQAKLEDFFNMKCDTYAMLYCKDRSDITIFHMYENQNSNPPALAAKECKRMYWMLYRSRRIIINRRTIRW